MTQKQKFINDYIDKEMTKYGPPYGMGYLNLLGDIEDMAERAYKKIIHKK